MAPISHDFKDYKTIDLEEVNFSEIVKADFPKYPIHMRDHIGFLPAYVEWIKRGTKKCTIRFRKNEIDIPKEFVLPILENKLDDPTHKIPLGEIRIDKLSIKKFGLLNSEDSIWDGFEKVDDVKVALQKVYGKISEEQYVSIYWFSIKSWYA